jgi:cytochrome c553
MKQLEGRSWMDRHVSGRGKAASTLFAALGLVLVASIARAGEVDSFASPELRAATALSGDVVAGEQAYLSCAVCHGSDGAGRPDGTFPQLAGQHANVIIKQLVDIRSGRRSNPIMHPYSQQLIDAQEIADVSEYLSDLPRSPDNGKGSGQNLVAGQRLYERDCQRCHGAAGQGDAARFVPVLAGQHYGYLLRQIRDISAGRRGNAHPEMMLLIERVDDAELRALVDYTSRLGALPARAQDRSAQ